MRKRMVRYERSRVYALPAEEAWRVLSNTDHLNLAIGLPAVRFSDPDHDRGLVRRARARLFGVIPVSWTEHPFAWIRNRSYSVRREFESGPVAAVEGGAELEPVEEGVRVTAFAEFSTRGVFGRLAARPLRRRSIDAVLRYLDRYVEEHERAEGRRLPPPRSRPLVERDRLESLLTRLAELPPSPTLVSHLRTRILQGTDAQVARMRPYAVADDWGVDRSAVLSMFLHATRVGVLELRWELMCPMCGVPKEETSTLAKLPGRFHCETCRIDYDADLDRRVEIRFSVHPSIRSAGEDLYCIGGPYRTPAALAQQPLAPGHTTTLRLPIQAPTRVRLLGAAHEVTLEPADDGEADVRLVRRHDSWKKAAGSSQPIDRVSVARNVDLSLENATDLPIVVVVDRDEVAVDATTAAEVTALQEFRDLFSSEVLAPDQELAVRTIALLFTDLKGSTSLYESAGDASAFRRVNRHFEFLREQVASSRGAIVKTIGDAVMAVFPSIDRALDAALGIQTGIEAWCREQEIDPSLVLRVGLHEGPVIAVNANGRLDYFGRTVNVAARVEGQSNGGDIVLPAELFDDVWDHVRGRVTVTERFHAPLRGVEAPRALVRLAPVRGNDEGPRRGPHTNRART